MAKLTHKFFAIASLLVTATAPLPAVAQALEEAATPRGREVIRIPCCRCANGAERVVGINTGSGPGAARYRVTGPGVVGTAFGQTITSNIHPQWTANLVPAQWIHPNNSNGASSQPGGTYNYTLTIVVPNCTIPMEVVISGEAAGDDEVRVFLGTTLIASTPLNASPSPSPPVAAGTGGWGFRSERVVTFSQPIGSGTHTLRFEVGNGSFSPHGLLVRGTVRARCPRDLERRSTRDLDQGPVRSDAEAVSIPG